MDISLVARVVWALAVIGAVLFGFDALARLNLRRALRPRPLGSARRLVTVVETTHLPNGATLHVVRIGDEYAVVGRSAGTIARLGNVPKDEVDAWLAKSVRRIEGVSHA